MPSERLCCCKIIVNFNLKGLREKIPVFSADFFKKNKASQRKEKEAV
jgi:hypothetical protein